MKRLIINSLLILVIFGGLLYNRHQMKERAYVCAELGYSYARSGKSKQELFVVMEKIIGKREVSK
jgi:hypothetical protein